MWIAARHWMGSLLRTVAALSVVCIAPSQAQAKDMLAGLNELKRSYADAKPLQSAAAVAAFEGLAETAHALVQAHLDRAEPLLWEGVMLGELARVKGGLGALGTVKQARKNIEQAEAMDPKVMDWSALVYLANLYTNVPRWPVAFGDKDHARALFERARQANPNGAEPRYFYGMFLLGEEHYPEAAEQFKGALAGTLRVGEQLAEDGFYCNVMICRKHTPERDKYFKAGSEMGLAKAQEKGGK